MTETKLDATSDQLDVRTEIECDHCGYVWDTESEMPQVTCPSCQRKTSREHAREIAEIPTRYIGDKDTLSDVARLFEERAELARQLYENGWESNHGVDGPNMVRAVPHSEQSDSSKATSERPPITDDQWAFSDGSVDPASGVGVVDYVCECPSCGGDIVVQYDDWDIDGKIVSEDEVFCYDCQIAVEKNLVAIEFSHHPKPMFRHTPDLRNAALKLRGLSGWLYGLSESDWYLDRVRSQYLFVRYGVSDTDQFTTGERGQLTSIDGQ